METNKARTENGALAFKSSGDARVDFFFTVMEQTGADDVYDRLVQSWSACPLDTLKLIAQLRDIKFGKAVRAQYFASLYWLYENHPRTLYQNLNLLLEYGCWKDLLQLLLIVLFRGHIPPYLLLDAKIVRGYSGDRISKRKKYKFNKKLRRQLNMKEDSFNKYVFEHYRKELILKEYEQLQEMITKNEKKTYKLRSRMEVPESEQFNRNPWRNPQPDVREDVGDDGEPIWRVPRHKRVVRPGKTSDLTSVLKCIKMALDSNLEHYETDGSFEPITMVNRRLSEIDSKLMDELRLRFARERFVTDAKYRYFHLTIADIFAQQLIQDAGKLAEGDKNVTLVGKWAPSLNCHFDRLTLISTSISLKIAHLTRYTKAGAEQVFDRTVPVGVYLARKMYNKHYLIPLRTSLQTPERYMCSGKWNTLPYHRVPAKCMQKNRMSFIQHDSIRFREFIEKNEMMTGECLKPHEFVDRALKIVAMTDSIEKDIELKLLEKQWESFKAKILRCGFSNFLKSCICICDVSGSMAGVPLNAAIGLTLLTMAMSVEPWDKMCITFSHEPEVFRLDGDDGLLKKIDKLSKMNWGMNTNLMSTLELVLNIGISNRLNSSDMPNILFIYTDMQFDEAVPDKTNFDTAKEMFTAAGYSMPKVVFWNLRAGRDAVPVEMDENGVLMLSGFSGNQLSMIMSLQDLNNINPAAFVDNVLADTRYEKLIVID